MERKRKGKEVSLPNPPRPAKVLGTEIVGLQCEVFMNSRRSDTNCHTFSDDLYNHLIRLRIDTFWDDNKDHGKGEEIIGDVALTAIWKSKISIPILSKYYASSKRCLQELSQMVDCKRSKGQLILPIFYDVQPCDVKHQSGCYEEAFHEHNQCFDETTVKAWKEALREVGELKGWDLTRETHSDWKRKVKRSIKVPAISNKLFDIPPDDYSWRKYGQKPIKGSPYPRGYYKCCSMRGCPARKWVERHLEDPSMLTVTYEGEHNHPRLPSQSANKSIETYEDEHSRPSLSSQSANTSIGTYEDEHNHPSLSSQSANT